MTRRSIWGGILFLWTFFLHQCPRFSHDAFQSSIKRITLLRKQNPHALRKLANALGNFIAI
ncbi:hypothetical protein SAMN05892877_1366 [Rhizobium subbaraonis]|uniref:Uncharacterized protein n=1 Tax=Rhizobium subbaraonis TaxID=908946 RepID=A0A285V1V0_9HYPH|nr:hypothetical protein SAMN05892877_1366 [Rhizobium subbaraonis]